MSAYRETASALRERVRALELELAEQRRELEARARDLADRQAKLDGLSSLVAGWSQSAPPRRTGRAARIVAAGFVALLAGAGVLLGVRSSPTEVAARTADTRAPARDPITLAIAIDVRPSLAPHFPRIVVDVGKLIRAMDDADRVAILAFDGLDQRVLLPLSRVSLARHTAETVLGRLEPGEERYWGPGGVANGIQSARELLEHSQGDPRVLVVTDARDAEWAFSEWTAADSARRGFRVSSWGAGRFVAGYLQSIARAGHGNFADLSRQTAVDEFVIGLVGPPGIRVPRAEEPVQRWRVE
jgi:hypothetical protein